MTTMKITESELKEMVLVVKRDGNWSLYSEPNFNNCIFSVANEGSGASDSIFGDVSYFRRWLKNELETNPSIEKLITKEGYKLFNELTF